MKSTMFQRRKEAQARRQAAGTEGFVTDHIQNVEEADAEAYRMPDTKEASRNGKTASEVTTPGEYVTLTETTKNTLHIIPNTGSEDMHWFIDQYGDYFPADTQAAMGIEPSVGTNVMHHHMWSDDVVLYELLKGFIGNGWESVEATEIGALTSAPILRSPEGRIYWHERYAVEAAGEMLLTGKTVRFDGAPENAPLEQTPAPAMAEPAEGAKQSRRKKAEDEAIAPPVPAAEASAAPAANPAAPAQGGGSKYKYWTTEGLVVCIEGLSGLKDFVNDKAAQQAVSEMSEELNSRPRLPQEADGAKAASYGVPCVNEDTSKVLEGDRSIPNSHDDVEDNTGITHPATTTPSKVAFLGRKKRQEGDAEKAGSHSHAEANVDGHQYTLDYFHNQDVMQLVDKTDGKIIFKVEGQPATLAMRMMYTNWGKEEGPNNLAEMAVGYAKWKGLIGGGMPHSATAISTSKAVTMAEMFQDKLRDMYLDAKKLTSVTPERPVREAVEAIFAAMSLFEEAGKIFIKRDNQEKAEAAAQEASSKPKRSGLIFAGSER